MEELLKEPLVLGHLMPLLGAQDSLTTACSSKMVAQAMANCPSGWRQIYSTFLAQSPTVSAGGSLTQQWLHVDTDTVARSAREGSAVIKERAFDWKGLVAQWGRSPALRLLDIPQLSNVEACFEDAKIVYQIVTAVEEWLHLLRISLKQAKSLDGALADSDALAEELPLREIKYWTARHNDLKRINEQLVQPVVTQVLMILKMAQVGPWQYLSQATSYMKQVRVIPGCRKRRKQHPFARGSPALLVRFPPHTHSKSHAVSSSTHMCVSHAPRYNLIISRTIL
jgi:hypothetical protein